MHFFRLSEKWNFWPLFFLWCNNKNFDVCLNANLDKILIHCQCTKKLKNVFYWMIFECAISYRVHSNKTASLRLSRIPFQSHFDCELLLKEFTIEKNPYLGDILFIFRPTFAWIKSYLARVSVLKSLSKALFRSMQWIYLWKLQLNCVWGQGDKFRCQ